MNSFIYLYTLISLITVLLLVKKQILKDKDGKITLSIFIIYLLMIPVLGIFGLIWLIIVCVEKILKWNLRARHLIQFIPVIGFFADLFMDKSKKKEYESEFIFIYGHPVLFFLSSIWYALSLAIIIQFLLK